MVRHIASALVGIVVGVVILSIIAGAAYLILANVQSTLDVRPEVMDMFNIVTSFTTIIILIALVGLILVILLGIRLWW